MICGASGGVSAMLSYFIMNFPNSTIIFFIFPMPAWVAGTLFLSYSYLNINSESPISHAGHLGGGIFGILYYFLQK